MPAAYPDRPRWTCASCAAAFTAILLGVLIGAAFVAAAIAVWPA